MQKIENNFFLEESKTSKRHTKPLKVYDLNQVNESYVCCNYTDNFGVKGDSAPISSQRDESAIPELKQLSSKTPCIFLTIIHHLAPKYHNFVHNFSF